VTWLVVLGVCLIASLMLFVLLIVAAAYGKLWFQAFMSRADVSIWSLIGMGFRQVKATMIVTAKVMVLRPDCPSTAAAGSARRVWRRTIWRAAT
jgi:uncharacterized protein YqfA (UPF0365 family)